MLPMSPPCYERVTCCWSPSRRSGCRASPPSPSCASSARCSISRRRSAYKNSSTLISRLRQQVRLSRRQHPHHRHMHHSSSRKRGTRTRRTLPRKAPFDLRERPSLTWGTRRALVRVAATAYIPDRLEEMAELERLGQDLVRL